MRLHTCADFSQHITHTHLVISCLTIALEIGNPESATPYETNSPLDEGGSSGGLARTTDQARVLGQAWCGPTCQDPHESPTFDRSSSFSASAVAEEIDGRCAVSDSLPLTARMAQMAQIRRRTSPRRRCMRRPAHVSTHYALALFFPPFAESRLKDR